MRCDEYDQLIEDPTGFLYNVWLPRVARPLSAMGAPTTCEHNLALVKGILAMNQFLAELGVQERRLREEAGTVPAIAGMLRAPLDILADKLRGYVGLVEDLCERPRQVLAACEALMPHLAHFAMATADPHKLVPLGFWMHRGCVPFVSFDQFHNYFWATLKPIVEQLWAHGHQTLFYAEGNWNHHLAAFAELPERSIVFHIDQTAPEEAQRVLGDRFCLSGGIPNLLLARGSTEQVRQHCARILRTIARDGGYILDASAIVQNDARVENLRAMTDAVGEFGVYSRGHAVAPPLARPREPAAPVQTSEPIGLHPPGTCVPWSQVRSSIGAIPGDEAICCDVWNRIDSMANMFIWTLFLVF
jgi:uroporphyrinogen-III decarboxylase